MIHKPPKAHTKDIDIGVITQGMHMGNTNYTHSREVTYMRESGVVLKPILVNKVFHRGGTDLP